MAEEKDTVTAIVSVPVYLEKGKGNWSAHSPLFPGCVSTGKDRLDALFNYEHALEFHLKGMAENKGLFLRPKE